MENRKAKLITQLEELRAKEAQARELAIKRKKEKALREAKVAKNNELKSLDYFLREVDEGFLNIRELSNHLAAMSQEPGFCKEKKTSLLISIADAIIKKKADNLDRFICIIFLQKEVLAFIIKKALSFMTTQERVYGEYILSLINSKSQTLDKAEGVVEFLANEKPTIKTAKKIFKKLDIVASEAAITPFVDALKEGRIKEGYLLSYLRMAAPLADWHKSVFDDIFELVCVDKKLPHKAVLLMVRHKNIIYSRASASRFILNGYRSGVLAGLQLTMEEALSVLQYDTDYYEAYEVIPNFVRIWKKSPRGSGALGFFLRAVFEGKVPSCHLKGATIEYKAGFIATHAAENKAFMPYLDKCLKDCDKLSAHEEDMLIKQFSDDLDVITPYFKRIYSIEV